MPTGTPTSTVTSSPARPPSAFNGGTLNKPSAGGSTRSQRTSSVRRSLNLASVGRAISDAIHSKEKEKERDSRYDTPTKEKERPESGAKLTKKTKEIKEKEDKAKRRGSAIYVGASSGSVASRASLQATDNDKEKGAERSPQAQDTLEVKTVTRHTRSMTKKLASIATSGTGELGEKAPNGDSASAGTITAIAPIARSRSLRPRQTVANATSALPKYRHRASLQVEPTAKPSSPTRRTLRRKHDSTDESEEDDMVIVDSMSGVRRSNEEQQERRPVSPLPKRAALKATLSAAVNGGTPTPPKKTKETAKENAKEKERPAHGEVSPVLTATPPRPTKAAKTVGGTGVPRPSSSSGSGSASGSLASPPTPKRTSASVKTIFGVVKAAPNGRVPSPLGRGSIEAPRQPPSPRVIVATPSPKPSKASTPSSSSAARTPSSGPSTPTTSSYAGDKSTDSVGDVAAMLSSVVSPTAPTPALPRIRRLAGMSSGTPPETPSRSTMNVPPGSLLAPVPPSGLHSQHLVTPSPRPQLLTANADLSRGSILSWEQLAASTPAHLGRGDIEGMLAETAAPFQANNRDSTASPTMSIIPLTPTSDIPESPSSPNLSALPSPGEYGSISQVILPDMTPSPSMHGHTTARDVFDRATMALPPEGAGGSATAATLLRLQLSSVEAQAKERLAQIQKLEQQLHAAKHARMREVEEMAMQVTQLEEQLQASLETRAGVDEERAAYVAGLEAQLQAAEEDTTRALQEARQEAASRARVEAVAAAQRERKKCGLASGVEEVAGRWMSIRELAEGELELVRANRETLAVLLAGLERHRDCLS